MDPSSQNFEAANPSNSTQILLKLFETSKEHVEAMVDGFPSVYCVVDDYGVISRGNQYLGTMFGIPYEKLLGENLARIFSPSDWQTFQSALRAQHGSPRPTLFRLAAHMGGKDYSFIWTLSRLEDVGSAKLIKVFGQDVTELDLNLRRVNHLNHLFDQLVQAAQKMMDADSLEKAAQISLETLLTQMYAEGSRKARFSFQLPNKADPIEMSGYTSSPGQVSLSGPASFSATETQRINIEWNAAAVGWIDLDQVGTRSAETLRFIQLLGQSTYLTLSHISFQMEMELKVRQATAQLAEANHGLSSLLDSLNEGYAVFDLTGKCLPLSSRRMREFYGADPAGQDIRDIFAPNPKDRSQFSDWFKFLKDEALPFDSLRELAPIQWWTPPKSNLSVQLNYHAVRNDENRIVRLAVVATDRTAELKAQRNARKEQERSFMVSRIIQDIAGFNSCFNAVQFFVADFDTLVKSPVETKRFAHTYKSSFAYFGWQELTSFLHEFEDSFASADKNQLENLKLRLKTIIAEFVEKFPELVAFVNRVSRQLGTTAQEDLMHDMLAASSDIQVLRQRLIDAYLLLPAQELLDPLILRLQHRAKEAGVEVKVECKGCSLKIYARAYRAFFQSLEHLFNNIVDHGFENAQEPDFKGRVQIEVARVGDQIKILIVDNGSGIDVQKVLAKAKSLGLTAGAREQKNPLMFIFAQGLSTKEGLDQRAGRGIGMEIVANEITQLRGDFNVTSEVGKGTRFSFEMPFLMPKLS